MSYLIIAVIVAFVFALVCINLPVKTQSDDSFSTEWLIEVAQVKAAREQAYVNKCNEIVADMDRATERMSAHTAAFNAYMDTRRDPKSPDAIRAAIKWAAVKEAQADANNATAQRAMDQSRANTRGAIRTEYR